MQTIGARFPSAGVGAAPTMNTTVRIRITAATFAKRLLELLIQHEVSPATGCAHVSPEGHCLIEFRESGRDLANKKGIWRRTLILDHRYGCYFSRSLCPDRPRLERPDRPDCPLVDRHTVRKRLGEAEPSRG